MKIKFGTSGWRAIISEDFTFDNVRLLSQAVSNYLKGAGLSKKGVLIGHDTRFLSSDFAREAARVLASNDIRVYLPKRSTPTPTVSYSVINKKLGGAIMISASHNAPEYNGFKFSAETGGPSSEKVSRMIEKQAACVKIKDVKNDEKKAEKNIITFDPRPAYMRKLRKVLNMSMLKASRMKIAVDCMNGIAAGYLDRFIKDLNYEVKVINAHNDPLYGGRNPDPSPENLKELINVVKKENFDIGLAVDGDSDRFGVIDGNGEFIIPNKIISLIFYYLVNSAKLMPCVARSVSTTHLIDEIAKDYGVNTVETPIGFKYIAEQLLSGACMLGAEESGGLSVAGHVPEKDGLLANLLVVEAMVYFKKPLRAILDEIYQKYGRFYNKRINIKVDWPSQRKFMAKLAQKPPLRIAKRKVVTINKVDGYKFILEDGDWLMFRPSGTEPMVRCYIESRSRKRYNNLLKEAGNLIETMR
ncbi:MAG: phosphoglucomutase/phosphomannomutase family protein [Candidatus Omnitrophica bacterium]|nr:phosphoglucomutase/phosphomannomutase family protein [Candidatus Omnitrophota bacterium]